MRLRPYKSTDAKIIEKWIQDEDVFLKWGGERFGEFPINADVIDEKYCEKNGDCVEEDNFYPLMAIDENGKAVGHFIIRYTNGDCSQLRFGWVIVDDTMRQKGYGKQMLILGLKYAFEVLGAQRVTIGVFDNNDSAHICYKKVGFKDVETVKNEPWNIVEMEILKADYFAGNSYSFFENRDCKYYPCHKDIEAINCLFCYCPLYNIPNCPGNYKIIESKGRQIKSCMNCTFPHKPENYEKVNAILAARL